MAKYDAKTIEKEFKAAASMRIRKKERGNNDYTNDAGYWEGGRCNWGANHNLAEDCETIAHGFSKLEELKTVEKELNQCTSELEFNSTKSRLARQAEEVEKGLQVKTGPSSSMFGICIIWSDYESFLESKLKPLRSRLSQLKKNINEQQYKYYEEIKVLKLEQKKIETRMKENKRKAETEKDPDKKALLLIAIEEDGKLLEENLKKQKAIPTVSLKFEPDKYVSDLINSLKKAIENSGESGSGGSGSGRNKNKKDDDSDDDLYEPGGSVQLPGPTTVPNGGENKVKSNQIIILIAIGLLVLFFFMNQKNKSEETYYDY